MPEAQSTAFDHQLAAIEGAIVDFKSKSTTSDQQDQSSSSISDLYATWFRKAVSRKAL